MTLEFTLNRAAPAGANVDCVVVGAFSDGTLTPADLEEDFIHSLQKHVEVDEPEAEVVPALVTPEAAADASGDVQFDRMTEEDLLRGLEGLVVPTERLEQEDAIEVDQRRGPGPARVRRGCAVGIERGLVVRHGG